jgi:drug/metabolite transporter (DMT)-like permease
MNDTTTGSHMMSTSPRQRQHNNNISDVDEGVIGMGGAQPQQQFREDQPHQHEHGSDNDVDNDNDNFSLDNDNDGAPHPEEHDDLMSLAGGSVVSVTESVLTGLTTALSHWKIIVFGQILALLMGLRGASTAYLYLECNVMAPTFQLWWIYLILSFNLVLHVCGGGTRTSRSSSSHMVFDLSVLTQQNTPKLNIITGTTYTFLPCFTSIKLQTPWWKYLLLSALDLEGNYLTYVALKYTSLKSASLLDTLSIPTAMFASYMCLRKCYSCPHLIGAFICLAGAMVMVFADYSEEQQDNAALMSQQQDNSQDSSGMTLEETVYAEEHNGNGYSAYQDQTQTYYNANDFPDYYNSIGMVDEYAADSLTTAASGGIMNSRAIRGDILAAIGGICWGLKDTMAEGALQTSSQTEFLGMLGLFGFLLSSIQVAVLEMTSVKDFFTGFSSAPYDMCSASETYGVFFAMITIFVLYYLGLSRFLHVSEAALLQLSLLASDLYAVLFSIVEEHKLPTWMFVVSMMLILLGVLVYESVPAPFTRDSHTFLGSYVQSPTRERQHQHGGNSNHNNHSTATYGVEDGRMAFEHEQGNKITMRLTEQDRHHLGILGISSSEEEDLSFEQGLAEIELSNPRDSPPLRGNPPESRRNGASAPSEFEIL